MQVRGTHTQGGFTTVEVMVALVLLVVAMLSFSRSVVSSMVAHETQREVRTATEASRAALERIAGADFGEVFALYNEDPDDDPGGAGTAPGAAFAVDGLDPIPGDPDGLEGEVLLPTDWVGGDLHLREDLALPALGLPRDLNGDGLVDGADHSGDYTLLPVRVRVRWQGRGGPSQVEFHTLVMGL